MQISSSKLHSLKSRPETRDSGFSDPRPGRWDPETRHPETLRPGILKSRPWDPGPGTRDPEKMPLLQWKCSRIDAFSFKIVVRAFLLSFFASHSRIVWISFYLETSSLEPFSLFYDLIASYYTKGKWQWRQDYLFWFQPYHFDKKMFLYLCLFLSTWSEEFI